MSLTAEPFVALYSLLPFILRKDLHWSAFQVSIFLSLRPVIPVLSFFWNAFQAKQSKPILNNLILNIIFAYIPFLLFPFLHHYWYFLFAASIYQLLTKALTPSLMEMLKLNIPKDTRESLFSLNFFLSFLVSAFLGRFMGKMLDIDGSHWKFLCTGFALIAMSGIFFLRQVTLRSNTAANKVSYSHNLLIDPLRDSFKLINHVPEFKEFQIGFMIGGTALMLIGPALSIFYVDILNLTHMEITEGRFIYMTIGVAGSSFIWRKILRKLPLNRIMPWILLGFGVFPLLVLLAYSYHMYLNLAFLIYGIAQSGSHLIWNLSGTIFSLEKDSSPYTAVNILTQGLRGIIAPLLGGAICSLFGAMPVLFLGSILCFYGVWFMNRKLLKVRLNV